MPLYRVKAFRTRHVETETSIEIEADSHDHAINKVRDLDNDGELDGWRDIDYGAGMTTYFPTEIKPEELDSETLRMFNMWITVCADSVAKLRRCDVDRAVDQAHGCGQRDAFCAWLAAQRPDLAMSIKAYCAQIDADGPFSKKSETA